MTTEQMISRRIKLMKTQFASNKIEGAVDENAFQAMLERARQPISNEEFAFREISRIYAQYGLTYVK